MSESNCGTCKYWGKSNESDRDYRSCTRIIHDNKHMTSDDIFTDEPIVILSDKEKEFRNDNPSVVVDGSGFFAALKSRKDFGCTLFQLMNKETGE